MSDQEALNFAVPPQSREEKIKCIVDDLILKEPKMSPDIIEFLVRLDVQYSGLNPESSQLSVSELASQVHLDVVSVKKLNMLTMRTQAEYFIHILHDKKEISNWLNDELERMLGIFLSNLAEEEDGYESKEFYFRLAEIFMHTFSLKSYVYDEIRMALETLMPRGDLKKLSRLENKEQIETLKILFNRASGCILLFNPEGRLAGEMTGLYLALIDLQVLLTAELESDLRDSQIYTKLIQTLLDSHTLTGAYDYVFAESHALLALHLQMEQMISQMLRKILSSKARLEMLEFRFDTVMSELVMDQEHYATDDAPDSMLVNWNELGTAITDIYCEYLVMSNINCVYNRIKKLSETIFNSMHSETFVKVFEKYPETPVTEFSSQETTPKTCESPYLSAIFDAPWEPFNPENPLALNGICAVSVLEKYSYIKKGDPSLGVCKWRDKFYALSSPEALERFGKNPQLYADVVHRLGHDRPELILLMGMQDEFPGLKRLAELRQPIHMMTCDKASRARAARLPVKEEWADAWSEWDKPRVLGTQFETKNIAAQPSDVQRDRDTQCAPKVDSEMQTMSDAYVNTDVPAIKSPRFVSHVVPPPYAEDYFSTSCESSNFEDKADEQDDGFEQIDEKVVDEEVVTLDIAPDEESSAPEAANA
ncbi:cilia- and flagella-associated protein 206-like [Cloeon dipterum]|uniref:cilia- and flagella-associated protein 206-like n=1 Tax=Cloeon dipterum TaxID=197152 RepID=UPI00321FCD8A